MSTEGQTATPTGEKICIDTGWLVPTKIVLLVCSCLIFLLAAIATIIVTTVLTSNVNGLAGAGYAFALHSNFRDSTGATEVIQKVDGTTVTTAATYGSGASWPMATLSGVRVDGTIDPPTTQTWLIFYVPIAVIVLTGVYSIGLMIEVILWMVKDSFTEGEFSFFDVNTNVKVRQNPWRWVYSIVADAAAWMIVFVIIGEANFFLVLAIAILVGAWGLLLWSNEFHNNILMSSERKRLTSEGKPTPTFSYPWYLLWSFLIGLAVIVYGAVVFCYMLRGAVGPGGVRSATPWILAIAALVLYLLFFLANVVFVFIRPFEPYIREMVLSVSHFSFLMAVALIALIGGWIDVLP